MNTEHAMLTSSPYANTENKPLNSPVSGMIEPVLTQKHKDKLMEYRIESAQIGQQITQIILTSSDPQTLLARIAKALGEIFQIDAVLIGAIALPDAVASFANPSGTSPIAIWRAGEDSAHEEEHYRQILKHLVRRGDYSATQPLAIQDIQASDTEAAVGSCGEVLGARAVLQIPTRFQSLVNGVIILGRSQPHAWTNAEKELLVVAAESVAVAISQVQLTLQVNAATRYQTLLSQLSQGIHSALDLDEILQLAIAGTARSLQVDRGLLLLLKYADPLFKNRPSNHLPKTEVKVAYEWLEESTTQSTQAKTLIRTLTNYSFWLSESALCQQAFANAPELTVIADGQNTPNLHLQQENNLIFNWENMPALLLVPLVGTHSHAPLSNTVLGFLVLQQRQPRPWDTEELEVVKWVSAQLSATIIQNRALRQVQSLVEDRTAQLQRSLEVQAKLYEKTRQQMDQLQQLNQLKEEFMSSMSHELRTPLTTMSLAIRMLRQPQLPSARREKYLEILEQQCNKEIDLINDLLSLQRLEADQSQIHPEKIDLMSLIEELAKSFEQKWADKGLTLRVESPMRSPSVGKARSLMLSTDVDSLNRILLELLTNAGKYSDPDTTVCLEVTSQVHNSVNQVVLTLSNTGPGISPSDLAHIFEKFRRGKGVTQNAVQGTGLGLALVKCLVQHLNGTIEVSSRPLANSQTALTSFTVTLPQFQPQL